MILAMRKWLAGAYGWLLIVTGATRRARKQIFREGQITSLYFHNPSQKVFRRCVRWLLKHGYAFISTKELIDILEKKKTTAPGAVWISLDDGWKENLKNVIPVATAYQIPLTIFLPSGIISDHGIFWFRFACLHRNKLPSPYRENPALLRTIPETERRKVFEQMVSEYEQLERHALNAEQVRELSRNPLITIGSHSVNHVHLPRCSDDELHQEIKESLSFLKSLTGKDIDCFAYPSGDYDQRCEAIFQQNGIRLAATTARSSIMLENHLYKIPRIGILDDLCHSEAICRITGVWRFKLQNIGLARKPLKKNR